MPNWSSGIVKVEGKHKNVENFCKLFIFEDEIKIGEKYFARSFVHQTWKDFKEEYLTEDSLRDRGIEFNVDFAWSCWSCIFEGYPEQYEKDGCITLKWAMKKYNVQVEIETEEGGEGFEEYITTENGKPVYESKMMPVYKCLNCGTKTAIPSKYNIDEEECQNCEKIMWKDELSELVKEKLKQK